MAEQMLRDYPETPRGIWTDARTKPGTIIVGIAIRGGASCVMAVSAKEWVGLDVVRMIEAL
jgi:hypothetical protein